MPNSTLLRAIDRAALILGLLVGCSSTEAPLGPTYAGTTGFGGSAGSASTSTGTVCMPASCASLGASCGQVPDGCGSVISCGECAAGETCGANGPNQCGSGTCTARTCPELGAQCGSIADGCGQVVLCPDTCVAPQICGQAASANLCIDPPQGVGGAAATSAVASTGDTLTSTATGGMPTVGSVTGTAGTSTTSSTSSTSSTSGANTTVTTSAGGTGTTGDVVTTSATSTTGVTGTTGATTGGTSTTGGSSAFPPITDFTANDGGFGQVTVRNENGVALFRPSDATFGADGVLHPIVVWGNGSTNTVDIWQWFLQRVASYGFVVVAPEQTQVTPEQMNAAIDYVLALAADPNSVYYGKVDTTRIASTGYSLGGLGALNVAQNERIDTTFVLAAAVPSLSPGLHGPLGGMFASDDQYFDVPTVTAMIDNSSQPAFGAVIANTTHNTAPGNPNATEAYIGWLRWQFMGDAAGRALFVGASCGICTRSAIQQVIKNGIDSL